ncbi:ribosome-inactivating family protein [Streptomyces sp. NPDC089919]|uniref:ribosome-inactivating family protein n=1 Tax=Streptomyces sp. NPDC089919 TaxID=3155188 RepID=UPI0034224CF5
MHLHPTSITRRTGRQLSVLLLALMSACSVLFGAAAPKAHAEVPANQRFTTIDWHLYAYDYPDRTSQADDSANDYIAMVNALRNAAGHQMAGVSNSPGYMDTPTRTNSNRIIRVLVWTHEADGNHAHLALYFNVDNLYFLGFSAHGQHYRIVPRPNQAAAAYTNHLPEELRRGLGLATAPLFNQITGDGSYQQMSAPPEWRGNQPYDRRMMYQQVQNLTNTTPESRNSQTTNRAMAYIIGATAEAARCGWIQRRIAQSIYAGGDRNYPGNPAHIGNFGTDLETRWSDLSRMAHNTAATPRRPDPGVDIDGRHYGNVTDLGITDDDVERPRLTPFLALYNSGR